jgi:hypothetical protein
VGIREFEGKGDEKAGGRARKPENGDKQRMDEKGKRNVTEKGKGIWRRGRG